MIDIVLDVLVGSGITNTSVHICGISLGFSVILL